MLAGSAAQGRAEGKERLNRFALLDMVWALLLLLVLMYTEIPPVCTLILPVRIAAPHPRNLLTSGSDPLFIPPKYVVQRILQFAKMDICRYPYSIPFRVRCYVRKE